MSGRRVIQSLYKTNLHTQKWSNKAVNNRVYIKSSAKRTDFIADIQFITSYLERLAIKETDEHINKPNARLIDQMMKLIEGHHHDHGYND
jgi:hypothetical protein